MEIIRQKEIVHKNPSKNSDYPYALSSILFETSQLFVSSELVNPGKKSSAPHFHRNYDEIVFVARGELHAFEGDECHVLSIGDSVCFMANSEKRHYLENKSASDAEFLLFRKNASIEGDVVY